MRFGLSAFALVLAVLVLAGWAQGSDEDAIRTLIDELAAAVDAGDAAAFRTCYGEGAVEMPPNQPPNVSLAAIEAMANQNFEGLDYSDVRLPIEEISTPGDWAFVRGTFAITVTPAGGEAAQDSGKWIAIAARQADGSWKITRLIWNSDNPPPGM